MKQDEYEVTIGRNKTTMRLSDEGVKEYKDQGYEVVPVKAVKDASNKARSPRNTKSSMSN